MGQSKQSEKEGENEDNLYLRTMLLKERSDIALLIMCS